MSALTESVERVYKECSQHLLSVLIEKYHLMDHLQALKRYLLLGQGDFVQCLMDSLGYYYYSLFSNSSST